MEKGISEIVGRAELIGGGSTQVYRALRELLCATCGAVIAEGALFTRRRVKGIGLRILPRCEACAPFASRPVKKERSALLRSLLAGETAATNADASAPSSGATSLKGSGEDEKRKNPVEEMRRRLGPALRRGRRGDR